MENKDLLELVALQSKKILRLEKELDDEIAGNEFWFLEFKRCEEQKNDAQRRIEVLENKTGASEKNTKNNAPI